MNKNQDIPKKVVILLMIALVTVTVISWITLTTYANTLHTNQIKVKYVSESNQAVGHVGITIVNETPKPKTVSNDQATVGVNIK